MSDSEQEIKKRGRPQEHKEITVSQVSNNAEYHRQYYHKVLKKGKVKSREPLETEVVVDDKNQ